MRFLWQVLRHFGVLNRRLVAVTPGYAQLARGLAWLFGAGSLFSGAALVLVAGHPGDHRRELVLIAAGLACAVLLGWRANYLSRWALRALTIAGTGATTTAIYLTEGPGAAPMTTNSIQLTRTHWLLTVGTFLIGGVLIQRLVHQLREYMTRLETLARTDPLTGVANRRGWDEELSREVARCRRDGRSFSVAILDIDHFKVFNDARGHPEGDALLKRTASGWRGQLRDSDFIARYGGEEFAVLVRNCNLPDGILVIERLREVTTDGQTCSAGIAMWSGEETPEELVSRADDALYEAKRQGRDRVIAAEWSRRPGRSGAGSTATIRAVVDGAAILSAYQPVVRVADGSVFGYEALARPTGAAVSMPVDRLFDAAQRSGLGRELDWVCRRAALKGAGQLGAGSVLFLNVGLAVLLDTMHDVDQMLLLLDYHRRSPESVVLEITEREVVRDHSHFAGVLASYREHGFRFALDDVGDGHLALETLDAASPEFIKVGPRLVREAVTQGSPAVLRALLAFADASGAALVAEGVEDAATAAPLGELGFHLAQGFHYGRPVWKVVSEPVPAGVAIPT
jgi:diguanylate cyclase (GGDEF)-like protein